MRVHLGLGLSMSLEQFLLIVLAAVIVIGVVALILRARVLG